MKRSARRWLCGDAGADAGDLLERLAVPARAGRRGRPEQVAVTIQEQREDYPGVVAEPQSVRAYPRRTASTPRTCSATSARSPVRSTTGPRQDDDMSVTAPPWSAGPVSRSSTTAGCAGCPATTRSPSTRWAGCSATPAGRRLPGDTLVTRIDARVQAVVEQQLAADDPGRPPDRRRGDRAATTSPTRAPRRARRQDGRVVAMASEPTYEPEVWVGGITPEAARRLYSKKAGKPLLAARPRGSSRPARRGSRS